MKKRLSFLLALLLAGCGSIPTNVQESPASSTSTPSEVLTTVQPTPTTPSLTDVRLAVLTLEGKVFSIALSPDGRSLAAAYAAGAQASLALWDTASALERGVSDVRLGHTTVPAREAGLSFSPDGSQLIVTTGKTAFLVGVPFLDVIDSPDYAFLDSAHAAAFYPDGNSLLVETGGNSFSRMAINPPSSLPMISILGPYLMQNTLYVGPEWDDARKTGLSLAHVLVFSPDGKRFAAGGGRFIGLWDVATRTRSNFYLGSDFVQSISFAPDGGTLAFVAGNNQLYTWDLAGSNPPRLVINGGVGFDAEYSPDGRLLAVGMADGSIQFRDAVTLRLIREIHAHSGLVSGVAFSPDGSLLVSSSYDGSVALWDVHAALVSDSSHGLPTGTPLPPTPALLRTALTLTDIHMLDADNGWAIDSAHRLLKTSTGGATWQDVSPAGLTFSAAGLFALDRSIAWVTPEIQACDQPGCPSASVTDGTVWHTLDGGQSWQASQPFPLGDPGVDLPAVPFYQPVAMQFLDAQEGWLLVSADHRMQRDYYRLFHTADGGVTWNRMIDQTSGPHLVRASGIAFLNSRLGWLAGEGLEEEYEGDFIYMTNDGGSTWQTTRVDALVPRFPCGGGVRILHVPPEALAVDLAAPEFRYGECRELLQRTHVLVSSPRTGYYPNLPDWKREEKWMASGDPFFLDSTTGWTLDVPGAGQTPQLRQTLDGGASWQIIKMVSWVQAQFSFVNTRIGWAIVSDGSNVALVHTTDGGKTWSEIKPVIVDL